MGNVSTAETRHTTPSQRLLNVQLPNGWTVIEHAPNENLTGGCFSEGYIAAHRDGRRAFLKAMDYSAAFQAPLQSLSIRLETMTKEINHEKDILDRCNDKELSRIVRVIDYGQYKGKDWQDTDVVEYLIFELASSDIRYHLNEIETVTVAWKLKILHQITVGLKQLHQIRIAHQDLKPSNVLLFGNENTKIGDLGRAACRDREAPHYGLQIPGDPTYASPESAYHSVPEDWEARRMGCDCYLLGSMVVYLFSGNCMTELILGHIDEQFHPDIWGGSYNDVLPYLQEAFGRSIELFSPMLPPSIRSDIVELVIQLTNPDYCSRGHPKNHSSVGNSYSLERYVSKFDSLYRRSLLRGN